MQRVAVLGAPTNRTKFGNKAVRAFNLKGFEVFPVNPNATSVEGIPAIASIRDFPGAPKYRFRLPSASSVAGAIGRNRRCRMPELWLNPGTVSPEVLQRTESLKLNVVMDCSLLRIGVSPDDF